MGNEVISQGWLDTSLLVLHPACVMQWRYLGFLMSAPGLFCAEIAGKGTAPCHQSPIDGER